MIGIVTALHCEARPLTGFLRLKKEGDLAPWEIYSGENFRLIVSGIGKVRSAMATTRLLSLPEAKDFHLLLNVGICGATANFSIGELVLVNQIVDAGTNRRYYPDMVIRHDLPEAPLYTFDLPAFAAGTGGKESALTDMEASGFYEAALKILNTHQVYSLKIVADHFEQRPLTKNDITKIISGKLPEISEFIRKQAAALKAGSPTGRVLLPAEEERLRQISGQLRLTTTQFRHLSALYRAYKIRTGNSLKILEQFRPGEVKSTLDRRKEFEIIKQRLIQP